MPIQILKQPTHLSVIQKAAEESYGDMVKAVVDIEKRVIAVGGEMHAEAENVLLENGSQQENLWGINLYPDISGDDFIEFSSLINIRPRQNNRSMGVEDIATQQKIRDIINTLITR